MIRYRTTFSELELRTCFLALQKGISESLIPVLMNVRKEEAKILIAEARSRYDPDYKEPPDIEPVTIPKQRPSYKSKKQSA